MSPDLLRCDRVRLSRGCVLVLGRKISQSVGTAHFPLSLSVPYRQKCPQLVASERACAVLSAVPSHAHSVRSNPLWHSFSGAVVCTSVTSGGSCQSARKRAPVAHTGDSQTFLSASASLDVARPSSLLSVLVIPLGHFRWCAGQIVLCGWWGSG